MIWTDEQKKAISGCGNLLISAAAGSGKTAVLTERIARLTAQGASIGDFLVVTFTRAAADEMKKRIGQRLMALSYECSDKAVKSHLQAQALESHNAHISTLHSFCTDLLRRHFHEADLDPAFRVADESEAYVMRLDARDAMLEQSFSSDRIGTQALIDLFGGETGFISAVESIYSYMFSRPEPFGLLSGAVERYNRGAEELKKSDEIKSLIDNAHAELDSAISELIHARDCTENIKVCSVIDDDMMQLRALTLIKDYDKYREAASAVKFKRLDGWPRGTPEEDKRAAKDAHDLAKKLVKDHAENFGRSLEECAAQLNSLYPVMKALYVYLIGFHEAYTSIKETAGVIDYSDMEHRTLKALSDERIAQEYRDRFKYIFVDEYQDSNPVQERILDAVKRGDNLFLVGDVKQSIYSFRLADPTLFMDKYYRYDGLAGGRIDLNVNFRSSSKVIGAVNEVFSHIMNRNTGGIEYDASAALVMGRSGCLGGAELHLIDLDGSEDDDQIQGDEINDAQALGRDEMEALAAARRIRELISNEMLEDKSTGEKRPYRYSDFVVLLRNNRLASVWLKALAMEGIPAYAEHNGGSYESIEVRVFINLLRVVDNRHQDIPLLSVLRSQIGGFTMDELIWLRTHSRGKTFYEAMTQSAGQDGLLADKIKRFTAKLDTWSKKANLYSVDELIGAILEDTGYYLIVSALPGGEQRCANLDALCERAASFSRSSRNGLHSFISFIDKVSDNVSLGASQSIGANVVRIMTVHRSKGLEFPAVILGGTGSSFRFIRELRQSSVLCDGKFGIGILALKGNIRIRTIYRSAIEAAAYKKQLAEEMRLLYVAMTRAMDRIIMIGGIRGAEKKLAALDKPLTDGAINKSKSFLDWILLVLMNTANGNSFRRRLGMTGIAGNCIIDGFWYNAKAFALSNLDMEQDAFEEWASAEIDIYDGRYDDTFTWEYPYRDDTLIPSKLTVSQLSGELRELSPAPKFMHDGMPVSSAERGKAAHLLMQRIKIQTHDRDSVRNEIHRLCEEGYLEERLARSINVESIVGFFNSELGKRLISSVKVLREREFNYRADAGIVFGIGQGGKFMLQGMIDCCFIEDGEWVIIDYKTDYVAVDQPPEEVAMKHQKQLDLYSKSLCALTGINVKERYVHLLFTGNSVRV